GRSRSASGRGALIASPAASNNVAGAFFIALALDGEIEHLAPAFDREPPAAIGILQGSGELRHRFHLLGVEADDDIATLDTKPRRRCPVLDVEYDHAFAG